MSDVTPEQVQVRLVRVAEALGRAYGEYHYRRIGPHALAVAANAAMRAMQDIAAVLPAVAWPEGGDDPGEAPRPRLDSDAEVYRAFERIWGQIEILQESLGPHSRELAGLYTSQGRILADVEALKGRLAAQDDRMTAQNDRMNGIATDLQGLAIDRREGGSGDAGGV